MKKLLKCLLSITAVAGVVLGALYVLKTYFGCEEEEDFQEEDFDDVFADEVDDREYVTLDIDEEEAAEESAEGDAEATAEA